MGVRFAIDVDGVLRNFNKQLELVFKNIYPEYKDFPIEGESYNLHDIYPIGDAIYDFAFSEYAWEIMSEALPYPEINDSLADLNKVLKKYDGQLIIVTYQRYKTTRPTIHWLQKYLNPEFLREIHVIKNEESKNEVDFDYLLDDNLSFIFSAENDGRTAMCLNRPWNVTAAEEREPEIRVNSIDDATELLEEDLEGDYYEEK